MAHSLLDNAAQPRDGKKIKCVVLGDGGCGKTSLLTVYVKGEFPKDYTPTVFENYSKEVRFDEKNYLLSLFDTAGQEEYDRLRPLTYDDVDVIILCYDVTMEDSFENVSIRWVPEVRHFCPGVPLVLVGCKTDLRTSANDETNDVNEIERTRSFSNGNRIITFAEGEKLAWDIQASDFLECSSKMNENISEMFDIAIKHVLIRNKQTSIFKCCRLV